MVLILNLYFVCVVFFGLIELKCVYVVLFCYNIDGELYFGIVVDFMGRDFVIFRIFG